MSKPTISAHMIVKNEENWVWYAIMSVIDYVDEFLVWDTGSTDHTVEIIKSINNPKIHFREIGSVDRAGVTKARQKMLEQTSADWIFIIDGDEIWLEESINKTVDFIYHSGHQYECLVHPYYNCLGDIYHYQDPAAGRYRLGSYSGHVTARFMNRQAIPGIHYSGQHGHEGVADAGDTLIQDRQPFLGKFLDLPYVHTTHLQRTSASGAASVFLRSQKYKYELGYTFPVQFIFPKPFYLPTCDLIPSPWKKRSTAYLVNAAWQTPLKIIKRWLRK